MKSRFSNRVFMMMAALTFGGCGFFNCPPVTPCPPEMADTVEVWHIVHDTITGRTDTLFEEGYIPLDAWIGLLDSVGREWSADGDSMQIRFLRGKDHIIYRVTVRPERFEVIRHDTIRVNCPQNAEPGGGGLNLGGWGTWPWAAFLVAVVAAILFLTRKKKGNNGH